MRKKVILFSLLVLLLAVHFAFISAAENDSLNDSGTISVDTKDDSRSKVDKAYDCLEDKVKDDCSTSLEDNIFTLLAIRKCKSKVEDASNNDECWPSSGCKIKQTSQAIIALSKSGTDTDDAEDWLIDHNRTSTEVVWYLQIESSEAVKCTITYDGSSHEISIGENKKINSGAGSCLSLSEGAWWLRISPSCYNEEFNIQCHDASFITSLLFKKQDSSTIYVSSNPHSASAEGTTKEKVYSVCFSTDNSCDYEGSLWATLVLDYLGYDTSPYLPYLMTMADSGDNEKYLPEAFLYALTGEIDFRTDLLEKQKNSQYWFESSDKFYDTAIALYPFQDESPNEKTSAMDWLFEVQDSDGCWGSIRDTAFLLHSIWPDQSIAQKQEATEDNDCEDSGYYCMSGIKCEGEILSGYSCSGVQKCCDSPVSIGTCSEQGGEVCGLNKECSVSTIEASDTGECCPGYCREIVQESECELYGGTCRSSCFPDSEEQTNDDCGSFSDVCCIESAPSNPDKPSRWWIWVLAILIILVILGIIFRDKLRPYWFRLKSQFSGKKGPGRPAPFGMSPRGPRFPPPSSRIPLRRPMPRRIMPPQQSSQSSAPARKPSPPAKKKQPSELDDVLKKLKEMGK